MHIDTALDRLRTLLEDPAHQESLLIALHCEYSGMYPEFAMDMDLETPEMEVAWDDFTLAMSILKGQMIAAGVIEPGEDQSSIS